MAYTLYQTSAQPKTNINGAISTSSFSDSSTGNVIKNVSLEEIQNAINQLSSYMQKIDNCGNCYNQTWRTVVTNTAYTQCYQCTYTQCLYKDCYYNNSD